MSLLKLKTDLKSLKYGKDTLGGGNSGQPYIQTPIPTDFNDLGTSKDFLLRGGRNTVRDSATDVLRLGKMFSDLRSPSGLLFIAKQNLLSRTAVRTQTSKGGLNEGVYSPLSTLAQAGVVAFGGHLNKQGIDPFSQTGAYANNPNLYSVKVKSTQDAIENRLVRIYTTIKFNKEISADNIIYNKNENNVNIISYSGGPGSILGVGNTNIRFADQRTGDNNPLKKTNPNYFLGRNPNISGSILNYTPVFLHTRSDLDNKIYFGNKGVGGLNRFKEARGVSQTYFKLVGDNPPVNIYSNNLLNHQISVYTQGNTFPKNSDRIYNNNTFTYTQNDIIKNPYGNASILVVNTNPQKKSGSPITQDFRAVLRQSLGENDDRTKRGKELGQLTEAPSYNVSENKTIENRVFLGDPGNRATKNYSNYSNGVIYSSGKSEPLDKINALTNLGEKVANDLVKFRITFIGNTIPSNLKYLHFRAFLDSMSDSYSATWNSFNYLGRNESFYTYGGYTRQFSLSWTVAAQSKQELIPMYKKLNFLASSLTGDYSGDGYMRGNLVKLTVGGYLYEQPGIITSLTYDVPEESPWEIGINTSGGNDSTVKELPHIIRVTGFNFIPIQTFIPQMQDNINGSRKYISLSNGLDNYNNKSDYNGKDLNTTNE